MKRVGRIVLLLVCGLCLAGFQKLRQQQLDQQILDAVRTDAQEVTALLQAGANPNARERDGTAALLIATATRKAEIVAALADRGADLKVVDSSGRTALHRAAAAGDDVTLQILTEHATRLDLADHNRRTPLAVAVTAGYPQAVQVLLEAGADPNQRSHDGETPLTLAAGAGLLKISALLLQHGAQADAGDPHGQTALLRALQIPDRGSNPQSLSVSPASLPSGQPYQPPAPLPRSRPQPEAPAFSRDLVALLLKSAVDVGVRDRNGRGVLDLAVGRLPARQIDELRRRGARCTPDTELLLAAALNRPEAAARAVSRGANVNGQDTAGRSALWWAVCNRSPELAKRLLDRGADPGASAETPLVPAIRNGDVEMARLLVRKSEVDRHLHRGEPLILLAVKTYNTELVEALLAAGMDPNAAASDGTTALHEAVACGRLKLIRALLDGGANVHARLWERTLPRTVLGRACLEGRTDVAALLHQRGARLSGEDASWLERTLQSADELRGKTGNPGHSSRPIPGGDPARTLKPAELLRRYLSPQGHSPESASDSGRRAGHSHSRS